MNFWAFGLLPTYTVLFAGREAWFSTNFSVRAVFGPDFYRAFLLWGILAGGYFYVLLTALAVRVRIRGLRLSVHLLAMSACPVLGYALTIPYLPREFPRWAHIHVLCAAASCVLVMGAAFLLVVYARSRRYLLIWCAIVAGSGALFLCAGMVTSALEVFFTLSAALLLRDMWLDPSTHTAPFPLCNPKKENDPP